MTRAEFVSYYGYQGLEHWIRGYSVKNHHATKMKFLNAVVLSILNKSYVSSTRNYIQSRLLFYKIF